MFQLGLFSLDTDNTTPNIIWKAIRSIFAFIDRVAYSLLVIVYQILFNIADATIFSSETIKAFYGRVQLIIGVFMIFKLSVSLLQAVINPDVLTDKQNGMGQIITRVVVMLVMFTAIIPLNIPNAEAGSYNAYLNENGLLFGTMYSLQARVLDSNLLGKLILGNNIKSSSKQGKQTSDGASNLAAYVLKGFVRINLDPNEGEDETDQNNWMCKSGDFTDATDAYISDDASVSDVLDNINEECKNANGKKRYVFTYMPLVSTVVGLIFTVILLGFCIDVAMRAIKLAVLRLIAPIPIISYIDPKSSKDGSFAAWTRILISTYLDLFLRLAIVYFATFLVSSIIDNGLSIPIGNGPIGILSTIFIFIGIFYFAKEAPKFIKDALGLKGNMSNVGLSGVLGAAGAAMGGAGFSGTLAAGMNAANMASMASAQGKQAPPAYQTGSDLAAQIRTGDPKAKGGMGNSINDTLMRNAGIRMARKYGVTASGLEQAKSNMYAEERELTNRQDRYDRFVRGQMDAAEKNALISHYGSEENARTALMKAINDQKKKYGAAKTNYEEGKKFGDSHRIAPSFEEEHRRSLRESVPFRGHESIVERPDMYNARGRGRTEHQSVNDRIFGSRENWTDPNSERTDNRWNPGTPVGGLEPNQIHDNPNSNIDTPGRGAGPGGPPPM